MINSVTQSYGYYQNTQKVEKKPEVIEKNESISKIEQIKKEIENGTYKIDLEKTAGKILDTLI